LNDPYAQNAALLLQNPLLDLN
jgi:hypothetical protein